MILSISDVAELKQLIADQFSAKLHFHDSCGGQYFTIDELTDELKAFLTEYFSERKLKVQFSESEDGFMVLDK